MRKLYFSLFIFLILVLTPLISAVKPSPEQGANNFLEGYEVEYTKIGNLKAGDTHLFNAHVFNISNGLRVTNTTSECIFHLFNSSGHHLINQQSMVYDTNGLDWEYEVLGGNFTTAGEYAYLISCNETSFGGLISVGFDVTETGEGSNTLGLYIIIYLLLFGIVIFGYYIKNEWVAILGAFGLIFVGIYTYNSGIVIFKNVATEVISIITIAFGSIIAIVTGLEIINDS